MKACKPGRAKEKLDGPLLAHRAGARGMTALLHEQHNLYDIVEIV